MVAEVPDRISPSGRRYCVSSWALQAVLSLPAAHGAGVPARGLAVPIAVADPCEVGFRVAHQSAGQVGFHRLYGPSGEAVHDPRLAVVAGAQRSCQPAGGGIVSRDGYRHQRVAVPDGALPAGVAAGLAHQTT